MSGPAVKVDNKPPKIFVSKGPAVLLLVDNKEVRAPIEKTKLEFVVNANWTVLFDTAGKEVLPAKRETMVDSGQTRRAVDRRGATSERDE